MIAPVLALLAVAAFAIGLDPAWLAGPLPGLDDLVRGITPSGGDLSRAVKEAYYPIAAVVALLAFILWKIW